MTSIKLSISSGTHQYSYNAYYIDSTTNIRMQTIRDLFLESVPQRAQGAAHLLQIIRIYVREDPPEIGDMGGEYSGKNDFAFGGQNGTKTASITHRDLPANQAFFIEAIDDAGQGSLGDQGFLGKLGEGHSLGVAQGSDDVKLRRCETQLPDVGSGVGGKGMIGLGKLSQDGEKRRLGCGLLQVRRGLYCRLPKYFLTHLFPQLFVSK